MKTVNPEAFHFVGIDVRTTNEDSKAMQDIPVLWGRFTSENVAEIIPNKEDEAIICMYTEYEGDHMKPYTTLLGCRVSSLEEVPDGMRGITVNGGTFAEYQAKGDLSKGAVGDAWMKIWDEKSDRLYAADYEVYGEGAQDSSDAEVAIFVSIP